MRVQDILRALYFEDNEKSILKIEGGIITFLNGETLTIKDGVEKYCDILFG